MTLNAPTMASTVPAKTAHPVGPEVPLVLIACPFCRLRAKAGPSRGRPAPSLDRRLSQRLLLQVLVLRVVDYARAAELAELLELVRTRDAGCSALRGLGLRGHPDVLGRHLRTSDDVRQTAYERQDDHEDDPHPLLPARQVVPPDDVRDQSNEDPDRHDPEEEQDRVPEDVEKRRFR